MLDLRLILRHPQERPASHHWLRAIGCTAWFNVGNLMITLNCDSKILLYIAGKYDSSRFLHIDRQEAIDMSDAQPDGRKLPSIILTQIIPQAL